MSDTAGKSVKITLKNVLYVPDLSSISNGNYLRLLSVRLATSVGVRCSFAIDDNGISIPLARSRGFVWLPTSEPCTALPALSRKKRNKSLTRGHVVKDIGSTEGIQSYDGQGAKRLCLGSAFVPSRYFHLYVMAVLSWARVVRVL